MLMLHIAEAYLAMADEEMRDLYMDAEKWLAIESTSRDEIIKRKAAESKLSQETA